MPGCTSVLASNFDPAATADDGSCTYAIGGCMDSTALNFNPAATEPSVPCMPRIEVRVRLESASPGAPPSPYVCPPSRQAKP